MKRNLMKLLTALMIVAVPITVSAYSFEFVQQFHYDLSSRAGFFSGLWHGLIAPWSLIARWFFDNISLYAYSNTGWFYDAGFLMGVGGSLPIGWFIAIIATIAMFV
jgi:hypothetical protein